MDAQQMLTTLLPLARRARLPWDFAVFAFTTQAPLMEVSLTTGTEEQGPPSSATKSSSVTHYIAIISVVTSLHFDIVFLPSLSSLQSHFSPELNSSAGLVNTAHRPRRILQQEISHKVLFAHILF